MRFLLAWRNMIHDRTRTLVLLSGMGFSILLLFMQVGFFNACQINSFMIYDMFGFNAVMLAPYYVFIDDAGTLPLYRAEMAESVPGVASARPLFLSSARLRNPGTGEEEKILAIGVDIDTAPFIDPDKNQLLGKLKPLDSALMDRKVTLDYGALPVGAYTELDSRRIKISGEYTHGAGFIAGSSIILSNESFCKIINRSIRSPNAVLLNFSPDADPKAVLSRLKEKLPADVQVMTRKELQHREQHFFMAVNPIGVMFSSGAVIAFLVGAVILYQILASEVMHHLREYATLKAMGYTSRDLKVVVMAQGLLMTAAGFIPSAAIAVYLYKLVQDIVQVPLFMTPDLLGFIFSASLAMTAVSGLLAVRRIESADPAELF